MARSKKLLSTKAFECIRWFFESMGYSIEMIKPLGNGRAYVSAYRKENGRVVQKVFDVEYRSGRSPSVIIRDWWIARVL